MTLLYFVTGSHAPHYHQANFSILSWLAYGRGIDRIVMMTDSPDYFRFVDDERVIVQPIGAERFTEWRGEHEFFWRIKIKAMQAVTERYPGSHVVYLDGDTFCLRDPAPLRQRLDEGSNLMHAREGALAELPTRSEKKMWRDAGGKTFAAVTITAAHQMWNAGVVAVAAQNVGHVLPTALRLCDAMCAAGVERRLIEQFSLSVACGLDRPVLPAGGVVAHYWGNKAGWDPLVEAFFLRHHLAGSSYGEQVAALLDFDFYQLPVYTRSSGTHRKLTGLVDKWFTKNVVVYAARSAEGPEWSERILAGKGLRNNNVAD